MTLSDEQLAEIAGRKAVSVLSETTDPRAGEPDCVVLTVDERDDLFAEVARLREELAKQTPRGRDEAFFEIRDQMQREIDALQAQVKSLRETLRRIVKEFALASLDRKRAVTPETGEGGEE